MPDRFGDFVKGLLIGGAIGALLGIIYAPKSGKETRKELAKKAEELAKKAEELKEKAKAEFAQAKEKGKEVYDVAARKIRSSLKENAGEAAQTTSELTE